jgi:hypothetical protein
LSKKMSKKNFFQNFFKKKIAGKKCLN